ncbi:unnamed protein product [Nesidiocoris tenuis]|uniref:Uncharacterized protein n=1 Tax=Nesidiocoris tenuis TaxID=355587 RepID=A0A6H5H175_9HEMI|nr:unnamed protein product [Nesidiocoris tenuis]
MFFSNFREKFRDSNDSIMGGRVSSDQVTCAIPMFHLEETVKSDFGDSRRKTKQTISQFSRSDSRLAAQSGNTSALGIVGYFKIEISPEDRELCEISKFFSAERSIRIVTYSCYPCRRPVPAVRRRIDCAVFEIAMIRSLIVLATLGSPAFSLVLYLEEGENCGYGGKCRRLSECPTAQADLRAGRTPVICSFDALLPIVCCHPEAAPDLESDWATTSKRPANRPTTGRPSGRTVSQRSEFLKIDDSSVLFLIFLGKYFKNEEVSQVA